MQPAWVCSGLCFAFRQLLTFSISFWTKCSILVYRRKPFRGFPGGWSTAWSIAFNALLIGGRLLAVPDSALAFQDFADSSPADEMQDR